MPATKPPPLQRIFTLGEASAALGKDKGKLRDWCNAGCPHERDGKEYRLRLGQVLEWHSAREAELAAVKNGPSPKDRLIELQIVEQETKNAVRRGELVEAAGILKEWQTLISACRAKLLSLGDKLAARLPIPDNTRKKVAAAIREGIAEALKEIANDR